jgi:fatty acid desaturase
VTLAELSDAPANRDYSLDGSSTQDALKKGLVSAEWYHSEVPRSVMKALMQRSDGPALVNTAIWLGSLLVAGYLTFHFWGSWWCVPFLLIYGVLYGSACDARWHECGHGTAFKTPWMNTVVYEIASFMELRNSAAWRWSHARHHTDTYIVGRDAEIAIMRPPHLLRFFLSMVGGLDPIESMKTIIYHAFGKLSVDEKSFVPETEHKKVVLVGRIYVLIHAAGILLSFYLGSWLPFVLISLPRFYGVWHVALTGHLQHLGLADNVLDHRLNTRTVYMNPISNFLNMNMNYHVEHHMFPMVPYHALPKLHEAIKHDLPPANTSIWQAYREVWPTLLKQLRYENAFLKRELPASARPYRAELHEI